MALLTEKTVKEGYMVKRSQNKKVYTLVNYKRRWFVLTKRFLIYYDTDNEQVRASRVACTLRGRKGGEGAHDAGWDSGRPLLFTCVKIPHSCKQRWIKSVGRAQGASGTWYVKNGRCGVQDGCGLLA